VVGVVVRVQGAHGDLREVRVRIRAGVGVIVRVRAWAGARVRAPPR